MIKRIKNGKNSNNSPPNTLYWSFSASDDAVAPLHFPTLFGDSVWIVFWSSSPLLHSICRILLCRCAPIVNNNNNNKTKHKQTHARAVVWNRVTGTRGLTSCRRHRPTTSHSTSSLSRGRWFCHRRVRAALRWHPRNELRHSEWPRLWHCPVPCEGMSRSNGYYFVPVFLSEELLIYFWRFYETLGLLI